MNIIKKIKLPYYILKGCFAILIKIQKELHPSYYHVYSHIYYNHSSPVANRVQCQKIMTTVCTQSRHSYATVIGWFFSDLCLRQISKKVIVLLEDLLPSADQKLQQCTRSHAYQLRFAKTNTPFIKQTQLLKI